MQPMNHTVVPSVLKPLMDDARSQLVLALADQDMDDEDHIRDLISAITRVTTIVSCGIALTLGPDVALAGERAARKEHDENSSHHTL